jgi:uncharacterized protein (TIGR02117 family)
MVQRSSLPANRWPAPDARGARVTSTDMATPIPRIALALIVIVQALTGCASQGPNRLAAEAPPPGIRSVFVVAHRYHTGLAFHARDVPEAAWPARRDHPEAEFVVYGWGARDYYPRDDPGVSLALRALFTPSPSTLNVMPIAGSLPRTFLDSEIVELRVPDAGFQRMVDFVRETYELDAQGRAIPIPSGVRHQGRFYASPGTFHAFENCNTWVARALARAGLPVEPNDIVTAGTLLRQVRALSAGLPAVSGGPRRTEIAEPAHPR